MATWKWIVVVLVATVPVSLYSLRAQLLRRRDQRRWKDSGDDRQGFVGGRR